MKLSELLVEDLVLVPFEAADKWQSIRALAAAATRAGQLPADLASAAEDALIARERSMTTGMEAGIAIPHAAIDGIEDVIAVFGLSRDGIPFAALDDSPARLIVGLIIPRAKKLLHIRTLAEIAKLLGRSSVRERLLGCASAGEVLAAVRDEESAAG